MATKEQSFRSRCFKILKKQEVEQFQQFFGTYRKERYSIDFEPYKDDGIVGNVYLLDKPLEWIEMKDGAYPSYRFIFTKEELIGTKNSG